MDVWDGYRHESVIDAVGPAGLFGEPKVELIYLLTCKFDSASCRKKGKQKCSVNVISIRAEKCKKYILK